MKKPRWLIRGLCFPYPGLVPDVVMVPALVTVAMGVATQAGQPRRNSCTASTAAPL